jgi:hypothetical protein
MEKISEIARYVAVGVLALFLIGYTLTRGLAFAAIALLFVHSSFPWWILTPAAIAIVAGFAFLFKIRRTRTRPKRKGVNGVQGVN